MSERNYFDIDQEINFTGKLNKDYDKFNEKKGRRNKNEEIYGIFYGDVSQIYLIINIKFYKYLF